MSDTLLFILGVIGLTTILCDGKIFQWPRDWVRTKSLYLYEFITCYMCVGFWVGGFMPIIAWHDWDSPFIIYALIGSAIAFTYNRVIRLLYAAEVYFKQKAEE